VSDKRDLYAELQKTLHDVQTIHRKAADLRNSVEAWAENLDTRQKPVALEPEGQIAFLWSIHRDYYRVLKLVIDAINTDLLTDENEAVAKAWLNKPRPSHPPDRQMSSEEIVAMKERVATITEYWDHFVQGFHRRRHRILVRTGFALGAEAAMLALRHKSECNERDIIEVRLDDWNTLAKEVQEFTDDAGVDFEMMDKEEHLSGT